MQPKGSYIIGCILVLALCVFEFVSFTSFQRNNEAQNKLYQTLAAHDAAAVEIGDQIDGLQESLIKVQKSVDSLKLSVDIIMDRLSKVSQASPPPEKVTPAADDTSIRRRFYAEEALRWTAFIIDSNATKPVPPPESRNRLSTLSSDFTDKGMFNIPAGINRVWIDVGADWNSFAGSSLVVNHPFREGKPSLNQEFKNSSDIFIIAIEANGDYYLQLKTVGRIIPLPIAMSNKEGILLFKEYEGPGCSSLLDPEVDSIAEIPDACKKVKKVHQVPSLRLERIINMIPEEFLIEFLKVDAQGVDVDVVKSAGSSIARVKKMIIEVQRITNQTLSNLLYKGSNTKQDAVDYMAFIGFKLNEKESFVENAAIGEENLVFDNTKLGI